MNQFHLEQEMNKTFDPAKPVQTRGGNKARILATDLTPPYSIAAAVTVDGADVIRRYTAHGSLLRNAPSRHGDLVNVPERTECFANIYGGGVDRKLGGRRYAFSPFYDDRAEADAQHRRDVSTRQAVLKLTLEGGLIVDAALA